MAADTAVSLVSMFDCSFLGIDGLEFAAWRRDTMRLIIVFVYLSSLCFLELG